MSMPGRGEGVNLNIRLRTDATPEQLLKEIALSPLIYIRLLGIVSAVDSWATVWILECCGYVVCVRLIDLIFHLLS